jgi:hypothetical protein
MKYANILITILLINTIAISGVIEDVFTNPQRTDPPFAYIIKDSESGQYSLLTEQNIGIEGRDGTEYYRIFMMEAPLPYLPWALVDLTGLAVSTNIDPNIEHTIYIAKVDTARPSQVQSNDLSMLWQDIIPSNGTCWNEYYIVEGDGGNYVFRFDNCAQEILWEPDPDLRWLSIGISQYDDSSWDGGLLEFSYIWANIYFQDPPPPPPENLTLNIANGHPVLSWQAPSQSGTKPHVDIDHYKIYIDYYTDSGHSNRTATTSNLTWTDTQFNTGGIYNFDGDEAYYRVVTVDEIKDPPFSNEGGNESVFSNQVSVRGSGPEWKTLEQTTTHVPKEIYIGKNYPNPFNASTTIICGLPLSGHLEITIFDFLGREVRKLFDSKIGAGYRRFFWDGKDDNGNTLSSGIYLYTTTFYYINTGKTFSKTQKMVFIK